MAAGSTSSKAWNSVRAATAHAVKASISTPVRSTISVTALTSKRCASTTMSTLTRSMRIGWHRGMSDAVCLAAWMPANRAASTMSSPSSDAERPWAVRLRSTTTHFARATRRVSGFGGHVDHAGPTLLVDVGQSRSRPCPRPAAGERAAHPPETGGNHRDLVVVAHEGIRLDGVAVQPDC